MNLRIGLRLKLPALFLLLLSHTLLTAGCTSFGRGLRFLGRSALTAWDGTYPVPAPSRRPLEPGKAPPLKVTWIGHATVLIEAGKRAFLTDPVFTNHVGRISKRWVAPGLLPADLPPLDAVLVSHMHFDHLSLGSLEGIAQKTRRLFVPEGGFLYLPAALGIESEELRWFERWSAPEGTFRITALPVQHYGFRYAGDRSWMPRAFTGYVIETQGVKIFFGGDTGYHPRLFKDVRRFFPNLDLAILPIAPIEPREFMRYSHIDPEEAVQVYQDLGARFLMPMHYDTFPHSFDEPGVALPRLKQALKKAGLSEKVLIAPAIGETLPVDVPPTITQVKAP
jgi:N-acyl-phosphatidylethanolamine-hydrolysing phospholipase D